ncbi:D-alanyl-D-alanine carboxypeptidase/D-alanyl-D-alanine-endopeptidase [Amycolatopsis sp. lyj-90]|uniref:D-alanyl-D-alanine carboxypeptidase/D-alanyl-D-alanine endopeptidase n=1 Tax=Amycolatopsis sp. lyj-90 TaxID=2789285 RepID=UPI00397B5117
MKAVLRSRFGRLALVAMLAAAVVNTPGVSAARIDNPLAQDLDTILGAPQLAGSDIGLVVRRADTGETLYTRAGDRRRQPASNVKLLTLAGALEVLGPDHRFTTSVSHRGIRVGATLSGDLYLTGGGDPTTLAADYDRLAAEVAASGIRLVRGKLIADDGFFDGVRLGTGWAWDDEPFYYSAQTSGLTIAPDTDFDSGSVVVKVSPGAEGASARVDVVPPNRYVRVVNSAVTGRAGGSPTVTVDREHGGNTFTVTGSIPSGAAPVSSYLAVWEPTGLAASVFLDALARHGIRVAGGHKTGVTPPGTRELARRDSMPLSELAKPFVKLSNNMHAEALVKAAGRKSGRTGSWKDGQAAISDALRGLGLDPVRLSVVDGSGLSRMDQVSPEQLSSLLIVAGNEPWAAHFAAALPVAGAADRLVGGTLRNRMRGTVAEGKVRAKTGSLTGVSSLSGYVTAADGTELVFSMIGNQLLGVNAKQVEDAVAIRLAQYTAAGTERFPSVQDLSRGDNPARDLECSWLKAC